MEPELIVVTRKFLTEAQIAESIRFAGGAMAAAGHFVKSRESDRDLREALTGRISFDATVKRAAKRAKA